MDKRIENLYLEPGKCYAFYIPPTEECKSMALDILIKYGYSYNGTIDEQIKDDNCEGIVMEPLYQHLDVYRFYWVSLGCFYGGHLERYNPICINLGDLNTSGFYIPKRIKKHTMTI